jgi:hypothetical protein
MERQSRCDVFEAATEVEEAEGEDELANELANDTKVSKRADGVAMKKVS